MRLFLLLLLSISINAQEVSSLQKWEKILQTPELLNYFNGVFENLGIKIKETGESFTIHHQGDSFYFEKGIIEEKVDFIVPLELQNIENMVRHAKDGQISADESWRILNVLFTPMTRVTLEAPVLAVNWRRKLAGVEDLTHVYLLNPSGEEASIHTLVYVKGQWLVLKGLHGDARRVYRMTPEQSLEYQRNVFSAMKKNSLWNWWKFSRWYKKWRKTCSVDTGI
ncbi:MAG: hypothetical protein ACJZZ8_02300 [Candidatus Neomarinimicrobiota bacterium]|jgi:hypothetical protein|tara:strand:- start:370 stop:1041 length:672 start_codon:yes stop_codon:yes gene_type:complete